MSVMYKHCMISLLDKQVDEQQKQLIEELRLELARFQVQNHELKLILQAKDNGNEEAISTKLTDYMTKVIKIYPHSAITATSGFSRVV